jgi:hypothetical protein
LGGIVTKKGFRAWREKSRKLISKAKQKKDRNVVHSPDMDAGTSDNRCSEGYNIRDIYAEKVGWVFGLNSP